MKQLHGRESSLRSVVDGSAASKGSSRSALSPKSACRVFSERLTAYEQQEIYTYDQVYYAGVLLSNKKAINSTAADGGGFDDDEHSYRLTAHDHIAYRYEVLKVIGKGSFGQVIV